MPAAGTDTRNSVEQIDRLIVESFGLQTRGNRGFSFEIRIALGEIRYFELLMADPSSARGAPPSKGLHLFLDDLHLVEDTHCLRSLHAFIGKLPRDVRVTSASRTSRPLPLARWRVEGELIEFTQSDLALSDEEAAVVLSEFGIEVEPDVVSLLNERVEGWPAGIMLACMALRDVTDSSEFIRTFAGTDRSVADFLMTEVLTQLTPANRKFLHQTAVLRQMSGELCDAVTGRHDSARILA